MELPFTSRLPKGFTPGNTLVVTAKANDDDAWLAITFLSGNDILVNKHEFPASTVAFQFQLRFNEKIAVLNSCVNESWGHEERHELNIDPDEKIKVKISSTEDGFEVELNGEHFADFKHREDVCDISHVNVYGDVVIQKLKAK